MTLIVSPLISLMKDQVDALEAIANGRPEFLLTIPERLAPLGKRNAHDFRPSYLDLAHAIQQLGTPPVLALTATASQEVAEDIVRQLQLTDVAVINTGIYRDNLQYEVEPVDDEAAGSGWWPKPVRTDGPGIVYCGGAATRSAWTMKRFGALPTKLKG